MSGFFDKFEKKDTDAVIPITPAPPVAVSTNIYGEKLDSENNPPFDPSKSLEEQGNLPYGNAGLKNDTHPMTLKPEPMPQQNRGEQPSPIKKSSSWMPASQNPAWLQINAARAKNLLDEKTYYVLMGIAGPPKSGKSGSVLDSLTDEEKDNGAEIHHIDFDLGGETTKAAHHSGTNNIVVLNPWVINRNPSRVPYDFPATYQRTIDYLRAAVEMADAQLVYFNEHGVMPSPYLKTVVFDGADHWLNICETVMKVDDLKLGPDGIAVAGRDATTKIGRFNWNIRKNRYNSALTVLQELCRRGIHCYLITHMKTAYDSTGNEILGAESPHWLKDTEGWLQQMAIFEVNEERDERGELTGVLNSYSIVTQNRTSLKSSGKIHIFRRDKEGGEWFGWKGLRDGSLEHPDDHAE
tara:strand:- start:843 stop:2069 length:1227 start_codon:yes stop_codon:yes gene_type:complete